jgi:hypothetical protein
VPAVTGAIVATAVVPLSHVPPVDDSDKTIADPTQTLSGPVIVAGNGLTVITAVEMQPVPIV